MLPLRMKRERERERRTVPPATMHVAKSLNYAAPLRTPQPVKAPSKVRFQRSSTNAIRRREGRFATIDDRNKMYALQAGSYIM